MILEEMQRMIEAAKQADNVVVVGAGTSLTSLLAVLRNNGITVNEIFDNNTNLQGIEMDGVIVHPFHKAEGKTIYVISVVNEKNSEAMEKQLTDMGVPKEWIIKYPHVKRNLDVDCKDKNAMKKVLDDMYCERFGKTINWTNPTTYTEIVNYEKVYDETPLKKMFADKYRVREYVKDKIGVEHLTKYHGVWNNVEEIDFSAIPEKCVLKTNNGSGRNILVTDKSSLNVNKAKDDLKRWMVSDYWKGLLETQYKDIEPKIICEEYLDDMAEGLCEYQFFCFGGKPKYIWCVRGSHRLGCKATFYDTEWNGMDFSLGYPVDEEKQPKPQRLSDMLVIAEKLSKDLAHVRVDLYEMPDGRILFGELTMCSWGGMKHFVPEKWDLEFGKLILEAKRSEAKNEQ